MSSTQADLNYQYNLIIPPDHGIYRNLSVNSNAQNNISPHFLKTHKTEIYFQKLISIVRDTSLRLQRGEKRYACQIVSIIIVVLIVTSGSLLAVKIFKKDGTILEPGSNSQNNILSVNPKRMELLNTREIDFESIPKSVEELEINSLLLINPYTPRVQENKFIRTLIISCPISELWIAFLLTTFPEVETLYLNEDEMCGFRGLAEKENKFPALSLPNLMTLKISNANGKCPVTERIFSKWSLQNLKHLNFIQSKIDFDYYLNVNKFLTKLKSSLESIEILQSVICKECEFAMNDSYEKLTKIIISTIL